MQSLILLQFWNYHNWLERLHISVLKFRLKLLYFRLQFLDNFFHPRNLSIFFLQLRFKLSLNYRLIRLYLLRKAHSFLVSRFLKE